MKTIKNVIVLSGIVVLFLIVLGCPIIPDGDSVSKGTAGFSFKLPLGHTYDTIQISGDGPNNATVSETWPIPANAETVTGTITDLVAGTWTFIVQVLENGQVKCEGQGTCTVYPGETTQLTIVVEPVTGSVEIIVIIPGGGFSEDFNNGVADNWIDDATGRWSVSGGKYVITGNYSYWAYSYYNQDFSDFTYSVDVKQTAGTTNYAYGIYFKSPDGAFITNQNGYRLTINSNGSWYLISYVNGVSTWINSAGAWDSSSYLNTGINVVNNIKVVCSGSNITIYFNNYLEESISDSTHSSGKAGVHAFEESHSFSFDNANLSLSVALSVPGVVTAGATGGKPECFTPMLLK